LQALRASGTSSGTVQAQVRFFNKDGTTNSTTTSISSAVTGSYVTYTGTALVAPAGVATFSVRIKATALAGSPTKIRVKDVVADRRTIADRMSDDSVLARTVHATDNLTSKHTSTAALFQAASGSSGWKGGTSGLFFYDGAGLAFEAVSGGVYVRGALEAGGILIDSDIIDFGGLYTIEYTGSSFEVNAALTDFSGAVAAGGALSTSSTLTVSGTGTFNGAFDHNGSTFGVLGAAPHGVIGLNNGLTNAQRITNIEQLLEDFGFATV
jgi:hypothetical protein